jgi:malate dehydrogenase
MRERRVIGAELIAQARRRGRVVFEVLPGDIVTSLATETAQRLGIELLDGPLEKPSHPVTDGNTALRRGLYRRGAKWVAPARNAVKTAKRFGKIAIVGAGGVGANIAHLAANNDVAEEITLIDIAPGVAEAIALDLNHTSGITRTRSKVSGSADLAQVAGASVVLVTAGRARSPGMTRADLINVNKRIIHSVGEVLKAQVPNAIVIVITNPLDEMTVEMLRVTGFPRERVLGMAGTLDSSRFRVSLAKAAGVTTADVEAIALGSHGDEMVPVTSQARIKGRSLDELLSQQQIDACVHDAITGGGQVVALKKSGSATIAPAHSSVELLDHMRGAKSGSVPVSVMLQGEYGLSNVVLGVPAVIGMSGLLGVDQLPLTDDELQLLETAAESIATRLGLS